ncbi:hypothetical protein C5L21_000317 [Leuconostoc citreum]|nr:hypothetical protein C5L21_000478 [Leuconostoc citreum]TDG64747.1 hypothetical protein C5L21_000317 [Leuconostoc citreum]
MTLWLAQVIGLVFVVGSAFIMGVVVGDSLKEERKA